MTKAKAESFKVTDEKVETLKDLLAGFWAVDLQRAWKCGFDAGRNSVGIVPIVKRPKKKAKSKSDALVIGAPPVGQKCLRCHHVSQLQRFAHEIRQG